MSMQTPNESVLPVEAPFFSSKVTQCVILEGISWETYERLLAEHTESSGTHFTYDQGRLEIMVLSAEHEALKHALEVLVEIFAEELNKAYFHIERNANPRILFLDLSFKLNRILQG